MNYVKLTALVQLPVGLHLHLLLPLGYHLLHSSHLGLLIVKSTAHSIF
jgi:hypothetical protein